LIFQGIFVYNEEWEYGYNKESKTLRRGVNTLPLQMSKPFLVFLISWTAGITVFLATSLLSIYPLYAQENLTITHGIASGDVTDQSAIIWARANTDSQMHIMYDTDPGFKSHSFANTTDVADSATDYTSMIRLQHLEPGTVYYYNVWFSDPDNATGISNSELGKFITAPVAGPAEANSLNASSKEITFLWGGDVGGQMYCRNAQDGGYSIFNAMASLQPDFFIANGDMIYADGTCPQVGPTFTVNTTATLDQNFTWQNIPADFNSISNSSIDWTNKSKVKEIYQDHWKYNRNDPYFKDFLKNTSMYSQWDDHEVINDFGSEWSYWNLFNLNRSGYANIVEEGTKAFFHYSPIDANQSNNNIYRNFSWGNQMDLFITDARSYRDQNHIVDTPENNKTLFGRDQVEWLKQHLSNSNATWKIVSNDVPISIPTGSNASILGRDGWADGNETDFSAYTGFERELADLLAFIDDQNIENIVFITTDVHFPAFIKYEKDLNGDGDNVTFHELVSGPLNAVRGGTPFPALDQTFNPTLLYGEGNLFNFGLVQIKELLGPEGEDRPHLIAEIRDERGNLREGSYLEIIPR
jgi:alkaline phosphatase D